MKDEEKSTKQLVSELAKLRENNALLQVITEKAFDYIIQVDRSGIITFINRASPAHTVDDIIGTNIVQWIEPQCHKAFQDALQQVFKTGKCVSYESVSLPAKKHYINHVEPVKSHDKVSSLILTSRDITDLKKAEEALRESEQRYRILFNQAQIGIGLSDTNGKVISQNKAMENITGYSIEDRQSIGMADTYGNIKDREVLLNTLRKNGEVINHPVQLLRKGGIPYDALLNIGAVTIQGEDLYLTTCVDITEHKKWEDERIKLQKLESIGTLAAGIAHDFNNLLGGLFGYIEMALERAAGDEKLTYYLEKAMTAFTLAKDLTGHLLTFSKGGDPSKSVVSVHDILQKTEQVALSGSNVSCEYIIAKKLCLIKADKGQLSQVFTNILLNSREAMPVGGTITIQCSNRELENNRVSDLTEGRYIQIVIKDTGSGIPEELLPKVFDPFFSTKKLGSGLGLATSYSIIRKHGGCITIDSEPGAGTAVNILLPATDTRISKEPFEQLPVSKGTGGILIMDDYDMILKATGLMLKNLGYSFECAKNGEEAVKLYKRSIKEKKKFDAVILDLTVVGGMGGEETIKKLLEIDPEVKGIVSSGYSDDPILAKPEKYGFLGKIAKPYRKSELARVLMRLSITNR